jgi:hypothetical protein
VTLYELMKKLGLLDDDGMFEKVMEWIYEREG